jgi:hypothetical protein
MARAKASRPSSSPNYAEFYDGCKKHGLRLRLAIHAFPDVPNPREGFYVPKEHAPKLIFFLTVWDGETLCCSGDLGGNLGVADGDSPLLRMTGALLSQGRAIANDFPYLASDPE